MGERINFGDLSEEYSREEDARVVIIPVAYDGTSTWIKGADKGPEAILEASANMELYDIETSSEVYLKGIFTDEGVDVNSSPEEMASAVRERVVKYLDKDKFAVVIGGEHSVSIGAIEGHIEKYGNSITVLQLDAHLDLREEYDGSKYNHACVMARVKDKCGIVQVGIRSMDVEGKGVFDREKVFFAHEIWDNNDWEKKVISQLTEKVYISIDLDFFDPSIMPSTGTPEPGGLGWYESLGFLKKVFTGREVVGFDVVELCPNASDKGPDFLAAKLIYKLLSYKFGGLDG